MGIMCTKFGDNSFKPFELSRGTTCKCGDVQTYGAFELQCVWPKVSNKRGSNVQILNRSQQHNSQYFLHKTNENNFE